MNPDQQVGVKVEEKSILAASVRKNSWLPPNLLDMREHILERRYINATPVARLSKHPAICGYMREYIRERSLINAAHAASASAEATV